MENNIRIIKINKDQIIKIIFIKTFYHLQKKLWKLLKTKSIKIDFYKIKSTYNTKTLDKNRLEEKNIIFELQY